MRTIEMEGPLSEGDLAELDRLQLTHPNLWSYIRICGQFLIEHGNCPRKTASEVSPIEGQNLSRQSDEYRDANWIRQRLDGLSPHYQVLELMNWKAEAQAKFLYRIVVMVESLHPLCSAEQPATYETAKDHVLSILRKAPLFRM